MPQIYNLNNGEEYWKPGVAPEATDATNDNSLLPAPAVPDDGSTADPSDPNSQPLDAVPDFDAAQLSESVERTRLTSVVTEASFVKLSSADTSDDDPEPLGAEVDIAVDELDAVTPLVSGSITYVEEDAASLAFDPDGMDFGLTRLENSARLPVFAFFNDPYLIGLISQAFAGNQELRILSEEIQIARNEAYARSGEYRPFVTLGVGAGLDKPGRYTRQGAVEDQLKVAPGREFPEPLPDFLTAASVSWELDIWRKLRNAQDAAAMRYLGTREGRNYIVTRLVAEVADNYYELLALDNRLTTLKKTVEIQQQSLAIAKAKKDAGRGTELAVQRFQAEVQKNQSEGSILAQRIVEVENRINFLLGRYPQRVERSSVEYVDLNLNALSAGVPSQLLQNRADIRQAEREVAAAGLDVRVARARFYPSLTLTGGVGWNAFSTGYLFKTPESLIYGVAGELVGPLINKRAIQADYRSANAAQLQSIYNYQQTILKAHIEVVNQISKVENLRNSIEVKKKQLESLEASVDAASKLFQNARAEYVEVLLAQRELMEAKMLLIETKQQQLAAIVNAYQALGGGGF